jgi:hypothetical protein
VRAGPGPGPAESPRERRWARRPVFFAPAVEWARGRLADQLRPGAGRVVAVLALLGVVVAIAAVLNGAGAARKPSGTRARIATNALSELARPLAALLAGRVRVGRVATAARARAAQRRRVARRRRVLARRHARARAHARARQAKRAAKHAAPGGGGAGPIASAPRASVSSPAPTSATGPSSGGGTPRSGGGASASGGGGGASDPAVKEFGIGG